MSNRAVRHILLFACAATLERLSAQEVFSSTYEVGYNNIAWVRGVPMSDGGFMISARPTDSTPGSFAASILMVDSLGDEPTMIRYEHGGSDLISCMERIPGGDVIVGSLTRSHFGTEGMDDIMVRRLTSDGSVVWAKAFMVEGALGSSLYDIVQPAPGVLIGAGQFLDSLEHGHPMLFRMSQEGAIEWVREIVPEMGSMQVRSLSVDPSGGVVATVVNAVEQGMAAMVLMHVDQEGGISWAHQYGSVGHNEPSIAMSDPAGGWVVLGRFGDGGSPSGAIIRTDAFGVPASMAKWGYRTETGHAFFDGSLLLLSQYEEGSAIIRLNADLTIPWWTTVNATPWGEMIPFDEATRFAYVSSEIFADVTINTLTAECQACNTSPSPFPIVEATWVEHGSIEAYGSPRTMASVDLDMLPTVIPTTRSMVCSEGVAIPDLPSSGTPDIECRFDPFEHSLVVQGLPNEVAGMVLFNMRGEQVAVSVTTDISFSSTAARFRLPAELSRGVYSAMDPRTRAACRFVALPR